MSPLDVMVREHWEAGRTAGWPMLEDLSDADRYRLKEQMRAALTALRDNGVTEGMAKAASSPYRVMSKFASMKDLEADRFRAMLDAALTEAP